MCLGWFSFHLNVWMFLLEELWLASQWSVWTSIWKPKMKRCSLVHQNPKRVDMHLCFVVWVIFVCFLRNSLSHLHFYCALIEFRVYLDIKYVYREFASLLVIGQIPELFFKRISFGLSKNTWRKLENCMLLILLTKLGLYKICGYTHAYKHIRTHACLNSHAQGFLLALFIEGPRHLVLGSKGNLKIWIGRWTKLVHWLALINDKILLLIS